MSNAGAMWNRRVICLKLFEIFDLFFLPARACGVWGVSGCDTVKRRGDVMAIDGPY